jgi:hypothetical protein
MHTTLVDCRKTGKVKNLSPRPATHHTALLLAASHTTQSGPGTGVGVSIGYTLRVWGWSQALHRFLKVPRDALTHSRTGTCDSQLPTRCEMRIGPTLCTIVAHDSSLAVVILVAVPLRGMWKHGYRTGYGHAAPEAPDYHKNRNTLRRCTRKVLQ